MIETSTPAMPQAQTEAPPADRSGNMKRTYLLAIAFLIGLQVVSNLLGFSKQGISLSPVFLAAQITAAIMVVVILAIPAGLITAVGSIWVTKGRGRLFMRSHFYLMALLIPMSVISQLATTYMLD